MTYPTDKQVDAALHRWCIDSYNFGDYDVMRAALIAAHEARETATPVESAVVRSARWLAIKIVDGVRGYSVEFASDGVEHAHQWDLAEKHIAQALAQARAQAFAEAIAACRSERQKHWGAAPDVSWGCSRCEEAIEAIAEGA